MKENKTADLDHIDKVMVESMCSVVISRGIETRSHLKRTQKYVRLLSEYLISKSKFKNELNPNSVELITKYVPLHDIGMVQIVDPILFKPGKITPAEFEKIKKHTIYGRDAILDGENDFCTNESMLFAKEIAYTHHEKWDGSGYPQGLSAHDIPIAGRLMAIADVYDALISKRVYKSPLSHKRAIDIIKEGRGNHFDPTVVDAFIEIEDSIRHIAVQHVDSE